MMEKKEKIIAIIIIIVVDLPNNERSPQSTEIHHASDGRAKNEIWNLLMSEGGV